MYDQGYFSAVGDSDIKTLERLLVALFSESELRQFIFNLPNGRRLHAALPGQVTSLNSLAFEARSLLERHGWINADLFDRLVHIRPNRRADIERVRDRIAATGTIGANAAASRPVPNAVLCNVPRGSQYFIGREVEMAELEQQLRQSDAVCVAASVEGLAGIGELASSLARKSVWRASASSNPFAQLRL